MSNYETVISNETLCCSTKNKVSKKSSTENETKKERQNPHFTEESKTQAKNLKHYEALLFYNLP
ncbi:MAG: hypothetical protein CVU05_16180 [Bacteroidetes bacterium HGW-Bacteroidetes-21]|jgi:hypothetical protein|nr:MAG: hypothetical protein CVU05_16180 [Bacteroidetes bacterium HGW-Bacteroidetes-21]